MTCIRVVALVLLASLATAGPLRADEGPMGVERLVELHEAGLGDELIVALAEREGVKPLAGSDLLTLREAGLSNDLLARLFRISHDAIRVEERDGVTIITGEGPEPEAGRDEPADEEAAAPPAPAPVVVIQQAPAPGEAASSAAASGTPDATEAYPVGAAFGWSGGAVFLPARFGGSQPSAFGRTIVAFQGAACCPATVPVAPVVAPIVPVVAAPTPRMIPMRTSRGEIWIPN